MGFWLPNSAVSRAFNLDEVELFHLPDGAGGASLLRDHRGRRQINSEPETGIERSPIKKAGTQEKGDVRLFPVLLTS